jgi:hypothetical protein
MAYDAIPQRDAPLSDAALSQLFTEARTRRAPAAITERLPTVFSESVTAKEGTRLLFREFGDLGRRRGMCRALKESQ